MKSHSSATKAEALTLVLEGWTTEEISDALGIPGGTIRRWKSEHRKNSAFEDLVLRVEMLEQLVEVLERSRIRNKQSYSDEYSETTATTFADIVRFNSNRGK